MSSSVVCPNCRSSLRLLQPFPAGTRMNCPKCQKIFAMPAQPPMAAAVDAITVSRGPVVAPTPQAQPAPAAISPSPIPPFADLSAGPSLVTPPSARQRGNQRGRQIIAAWAGVALVFNLGLLAAGWVLTRPSASKSSGAAVAQVQSSKRTANYQEPAAQPVLAPPRPATPADPKAQQWLKANLLDAYERNGKKGPWDADAREVLRVTADNWTRSGNHLPGDPTVLVAPHKRAVAGGCSDPLVLFTAGRIYDNTFQHPQVAAQLDQTPHHAAWRCLAWLRAGQYYGDQTKPQLKPQTDPDKPPEFVIRMKDAPQLWEQQNQAINAALKLLPEIAKDPAVPNSVWLTIGQQLHANVENRTFNELAPDGQLVRRKSPDEWIYEQLNKVMPDSTVALTYKGKYHITWAWEARGGGWANTVPAEGWRLMRERLAVAEQSLEKAWQLDNSNADAATSMITVELGQGKGRARMEQWFKRAMDADPDNYAACAAKLYYLEPKWHGNENAMLAFGRECVKGGNWKARLPFILVDAHAALARYQQNNIDGYYQQAGVFDDLKSVYEPYLRMNPQARLERSQYAQLACRCNRWEEADKQFQALGDRGDPTVFPNRAEFLRLKTEAAAKAGKKGA